MFRNTHKRVTCSSSPHTCARAVSGANTIKLARVSFHLLYACSIRIGSFPRLPRGSVHVASGSAAHCSVAARRALAEVAHLAAAHHVLPRWKVNTAIYLLVKLIPSLSRTLFFLSVILQDISSKVVSRIIF